VYNYGQNKSNFKRKRKGQQSGSGWPALRPSWWHCNADKSPCFHAALRGSTWSNVGPLQHRKFFLPHSGIIQPPGGFGDLLYGLLFGALVWPVLRHFSSASWVGWFGGLAYAVVLLLLAQIAILPGVNSPLAQLPFWQWAFGHSIYGFVLGGLFTRKVV